MGSTPWSVTTATASSRCSATARIPATGSPSMSPVAPMRGSASTMGGSSTTPASGVVVEKVQPGQIEEADHTLVGHGHGAETMADHRHVIGQALGNRDDLGGQDRV